MKNDEPHTCGELYHPEANRWIPVSEGVPPFIEENKLHQRSSRVPVVIQDPHPKVDVTRYYHWKEDDRFDWGKDGVTHWLNAPAIPVLDLT